MEEVARLIKKKGFSGELALKKKIADSEAYFEIVPDKRRWNVEGDLCIYVYSPAFGRIMCELFDSDESIAWNYLPRKLRKDTVGCLGMVVCGLEFNKDSPGLSCLVPADRKYSMDEFLSCVNSVESEGDLLLQLFSGKLKNFFAIIEGAWVYLYLSKRYGLTAGDTISGSLFEKNDFNSIIESWRMRKSLDEYIVKEFGVCFERQTRASK